MPHFLDIKDISKEDLRSILNIASKVKNESKSGEFQKPMTNRHLAMIFEKPSTRTRTSFEVGMNQLGGHSVILNTENSQLGRGESISDTAKVLSRYVDIIMIRCFKHKTLLELAEHSEVPVINGLTNQSHPCQVMADIMTFEEHKTSIENKTVAWVGDFNNMTKSWIQASKKMNFTLKISTPKELKPSDKELNDIFWSDNLKDTINACDLVTTDTWVSMGDENVEEKCKTLQNYQVNDKVMSYAKKDALFMHCLPAHRNEEATDSVIDGSQSVVFDEAENRLHIQKAIIIWCLKNKL